MPGDQEPRWSAHAERRLIDRPDVAREQVIDALAAPDRRPPHPTIPGRWIAQKFLPGGRHPALLQVFYEVSADVVVVVSFYRTTQVRRCWRDDP